MLRLLTLLACSSEPAVSVAPEPVATEPAWLPPEPLVRDFSYEPPDVIDAQVLVVQHGERAAVDDVGEVLSRVTPDISLLPPRREPIAADLVVEHTEAATELAGALVDRLARDLPDATLLERTVATLDPPVLVRTRYVAPTHPPLVRGAGHDVLTVWGEPSLALRDDSQAVLVTSARIPGQGASYPLSGVWEHLLGTDTVLRVAPGEGFDATWADRRIWWQLTPERHVPWHDEPRYGVFSGTPGTEPVAHPERTAPPPPSCLTPEGYAWPEGAASATQRCVSPDGRWVAWLVPGEHDTTEVHLLDLHAVTE